LLQFISTCKKNFEPLSHRDTEDKAKTPRLSGYIFARGHYKNIEFKPGLGSQAKAISIKVQAIAAIYRSRMPFYTHLSY
jgi:hypothetical protein